MSGFEALINLGNQLVDYAVRGSLIVALLGFIASVGFFAASGMNESFRSRGIKGGLAAIVAGAIIPLATTFVG